MITLKDGRVMHTHMGNWGTCEELVSQHSVEKCLTGTERERLAKWRIQFGAEMRTPDYYAVEVRAFFRMYNNLAE